MDLSFSEAMSSHGMTRLGITADEHKFPDKEQYKEHRKGNGVIFRLNLRTKKYQGHPLVQLRRTPRRSNLARWCRRWRSPRPRWADPATRTPVGRDDNAGWGAAAASFSRSSRTAAAIRFIIRSGSPTAAGDQSQPQWHTDAGSRLIVPALTSAGGSAQAGGVFSINPKTGKYRQPPPFKGGARGAFGIDNWSSRACQTVELCSTE